MPKPTKKPTAIPYATSAVAEMEGKWREKLEERTGKSFDQWRKAVIKACGADEDKRRTWLLEQGISSMYARWIASDKYANAGEYDPVALVDGQYAGAKAALRPLYDTLLQAGIALGADVTVRPCQTSVPLYRKFAFVELRASTNSALDLCLALGDRAGKGRLERLAVAGSNRIGHKVRLSSVAEFDDELRALMAEAYSKGNAAIERNAKVAEGNEARLPADFATALKADKTATATFDNECTAKMRADFVVYISEPKKPETRAKRIAMAVAQLRAGKKRMYC